MKYLPIARILVQLGVLALFCSLPWLHEHGFIQIKGSLFAFDAFGMPFADPASGAQAGLAGLIQGEAPILVFFLGVLVTLCVAFLLGRIFCGWLCPYGLFSDLISKIHNRAVGSSKREFLFKSLLFALALGICSLFAYPAISVISMPGQISLLAQMIFARETWLALGALATIPLGALGVEFASGKRLWCRYVCPQSVLLGVAAAILPKSSPGLRIYWNPAKCKCGKSSPCRDACKLGLNPRHKNGPIRRDCSLCGDCVTRCSQKGGALKYRFLPDQN